MSGKTVAGSLDLSNPEPVSLERALSLHHMPAMPETAT